MSHLVSLKACTSIHDFAKLLGFKPKNLAFVLYKIPDHQKYKIFTIPKKAGGDREIKAPVEQLKLAQKHLANILYACFEEIEAKHGRKPLAHGFKKHLSIATNAHCHRGKRYVFNIDLSNFFPTFNFGRVRGYFIKNNDFLLNEDVATLIAQIACHDNELPQGSPCSPIISNLLGHLLDVRLVQLAKKHACTYSRYADDITFSTDKLAFPSNIAFQENPETAVWKVGAELEKAIVRAGFIVNHTKSRMHYKESRQTVTGLTVNRHVNIPREYYRYARAMCNTLFTTGAFSSPKNQEKGTLRQLEGTLSYIHHIKDFSDHRDDLEKKHKPLAPTTLYAQFLRYKCLFALDKPLIICEGKTDSVYLKCALKSLRAANPTLIEKKTTVVNSLKDKETPYKIRFHGYLNQKGHTTIPSNLLQLYGGSGGLKILITDYKQHSGEFKLPIRRHPVILLIDNDSGAEDIFSTLKELNSPPTKGLSKSAAKKIKQSVPAVTGDEAFYYVHDNLYVVPTPKNAGKDTKIEDFFEPKLLKEIVSGKKFNPENTQSADNGEYGKAVFAEQVVRKNEAAVNFTGFQPLLSNITLVIEDYKKRIAKAKVATSKLAAKTG